MLGGVGGVGAENVVDVGFAVREVERLDVGHGSEQADDGFVGVDIGHGMLWVGGMGMDAEFFIDETFDAGLQTIFETIFAGGNPVINSATGEVLMGKNERVHFGMNGEVVLHWALV